MIPKFRGKRKDNGEWVVGVPIPNSFCNVVHMIPILLTDKVAYPPERLHEYLIEIVPETLGQSTGLKDKNGVEIFEGDVLKRKVHVVLLGTDLDEWVEETYLVEWKYGGWHIGEDLLAFVLESGFDRHTGCYQTVLEVIGTIYANPELLSSGIE